MRGIAATIIMVLLAGCAAQSVDEIKQKPSKVHVFSRAANYQEIYRSIAQTARTCWAGTQLSPAQTLVDTDLYSELGKGEITMWMSHLGPSIYLHALIQKKADALTEVTVYTFYSTWDVMGPKLERWADGSRDC